MADSTLNPTLPDNIELPAAGHYRAVVQFPCGCDAYVDIPETMFIEVQSKIFVVSTDKHSAAAEADKYVFGTYCAQLAQELALAPHGPDFCPATYGSVVSAEEQHG